MAASETVMVIEDLVSTASFGVKVLAGSGGLTREVLWAHSCELENPEEWLAPHELLMTVGLCVPQSADDQVEFIRRLDEAGLSGLMIGDHDVAPPVSGEMLEEADRREFPVLLVAHDTPYAVVARHVAAASSSSQILQVLKLSKLYQIAAASDDDPGSLLDSLAKLLRVEMSIADRATGITVFTTPGVSGSKNDRVERTYPLRGRHAADLTILEFVGEPVESFILVHLIKVIEVMADRALTAASTRVHESARSLTELLSGARSANAVRLLEGSSVTDGYQVAAFTSEADEQIARAVALQELPVLVGAGRKSSLALVPLSQVEKIRELAAITGVNFGVSSVFTDHRDVRAAAEEAARVLDASQFSGRNWTEFEGSTIAVLARSHQEAEDIISGVLGPLAESTDSATKLRETLFTYLRADRHWQEAADELGIHRQTLSYRLNRIEEEIGLSVTRSADLSSLWIAYQAWEYVHGARSS